MNALSQINTISEAEYLQDYACAEDARYEYINGEVWAMAGASDEHNRIASNLMYLLGGALWHGDCVPFASDKMVKVQGNYYFPDIVVPCGETGDIRVIVEILSNSTRQTDFTIKLNDYQKIPTLQEYILIEQDFMHLTIYRRSQNWAGATYEFGEIELSSLGVRLALMDIYHRIVFKEKKPKMMLLRRS